MADVVTVSALNKYVRSLLESDAVLVDLAISGEISNFVRHHKTGHCYFSIKDAKASVKAVMFRSAADSLAFRPENGMRVVVRGRITLYERDGSFQINVEYLFPDGVGAAQMAFDQLKAKLEQEGLFAPEAKKPLPHFPKCIGLVTSKTGAVLQDILNVAKRRCPAAQFRLASVTVQGEEAAPQIAKAIRRLDALPEVDVIIVARGGGSAEDLWVFNAEVVARAAFASQTPLVSAIGHETDYTILDFVADLRAPTPSAAAEIALPDLAREFTNALHVYTNIFHNIQFRLESCYNVLQSAARNPALSAMPTRVAQARQRLAALWQGIQNAETARADTAQKRLESAALRASHLSPYTILARGYSVAQTEAGVLRSVQDARPGMHFGLTLADGTLDCTVDRVNTGQGAGNGQ
ncbi:MAG: exodeoxyribonuclease VII large subunit [Ruminococcaceae bacterium]|nr:exodeoxyribonuclease VII large subunit [Oscillospiraceae bacterium]